MIAALLITRQALSQAQTTNLPNGDTILYGNKVYQQSAYRMLIKRYNNQACSDFIDLVRVPLIIENDRLKKLYPGPPKFLTIHGDIFYDFFYRSNIDTPIAQQNFQQHTERINLNILIKEEYPLKVSFVLR